MKKSLIYCLFVVLIIVISSCNDTHTVNRTKTIIIEQEVLIKKINSNKDFSIVTIDSCEYIVFNRFYKFGNGDAGYSGGITHKHNCKYCKAREARNSKNKQN